MPIEVTQHFKIDRQTFDSTGAFDAVLDGDARLFVDPFLLPFSSAPELKAGREIILKRFENILTLLANSNSQNDLTWKEAERLLRFREIKGFNLGYGGEGSHGSGMGPKLRKLLLTAAHEIVSKGIRDPVIFELVGLFQEGIGCDRISDMACRILYDSFLNYTSRIFEACGVTKYKVQRDGRTLFIPPNPYRRKEPVLLVPKDILRDLPIADDWSDISYVCETNAALRKKLSALVGHDWQKKTKSAKKDEVRKFLISNPDFFRDVLTEYKKSPATQYDFVKDPSGEANWLRLARDFTGSNPLTLTLPTGSNLQVLYGVINSICLKFRDLVEQNGLWKFLYTDRMKPKHESASQLIFYAVSSIYCEANNLSLSRESNAGRGPVDFKIAQGHPNVLVETKLSTNPYLVHAYQKQVPIYQSAEGSSDAIIVVIQVNEKSKPLDDLLKLKAADEKKKKRTPHIILVDGLPKKSASKA